LSPPLRNGHATAEEIVAHPSDTIEDRSSKGGREEGRKKLRRNGSERRTRRAEMLAAEIGKGLDGVSPGGRVTA
jgi:hypothetical protein